MVLESLGVVLVFGTIWAALQFEGNPGQEGRAEFDEGDGSFRDAGCAARVPESVRQKVIWPIAARTPD
jgi:hypothetical protein